MLLPLADVESGEIAPPVGDGGAEAAESGEGAAAGEAGAGDAGEGANESAAGHAAVGPPPKRQRTHLPQDIKDEVVRRAQQHMNGAIRAPSVDFFEQLFVELSAANTFPEGSTTTADSLRNIVRQWVFKTVQET